MKAQCAAAGCTLEVGMEILVAGLDTVAAGGPIAEGFVDPGSCGRRHLGTYQPEINILGWYARFQITWEAIGRG